MTYSEIKVLESLIKNELGKRLEYKGFNYSCRWSALLL